MLAYRLDVYRHLDKYYARLIYLLAKNLVYRLVGVPASGENCVGLYDNSGEGGAGNNGIILLK